MCSMDLRTGARRSQRTAARQIPDCRKMPATNIKLKYYLLLFMANIIDEEIMEITTALMISALSFCEIPIEKSPTNITKKKIYAMVSIGADLLNVANAKTKPRANCRAAHI